MTAKENSESVLVIVGERKKRVANTRALKVEGTSSLYNL